MHSFVTSYFHFSENHSYCKTCLPRLSVTHCYFCYSSKNKFGQNV